MTKAAKEKILELKVLILSMLLFRGAVWHPGKSRLHFRAGLPSLLIGHTSDSV